MFTWKKKSRLLGSSYPPLSSGNHSRLEERIYTKFGTGDSRCDQSASIESS